MPPLSKRKKQVLSAVKPKNDACKEIIPSNSVLDEATKSLRCSTEAPQSLNLESSYNKNTSIKRTKKRKDERTKKATDGRMDKRKRNLSWRKSAKERMDNYNLKKKNNKLRDFEQRDGEPKEDVQILNNTAPSPRLQIPRRQAPPYQAGFFFPVYESRQKKYHRRKTEEKRQAGLKRKAEEAIEFKELGHGFRITNSPKKQKFAVEKAVKLRSQNSLTEMQYCQVSKELNLPSISTVKRKEAKLMNTVFPSGSSSADFYSLKRNKLFLKTQTLKNMVRHQI